MFQGLLTRYCRSVIRHSYFFLLKKRWSVEARSDLKIEILKKSSCFEIFPFIGSLSRIYFVKLLNKKVNIYQSINLILRRRSLKSFKVVYCFFTKEKLVICYRSKTVHHTVIHPYSVIFFKFVTSLGISLS